MTKYLRLNTSTGRAETVTAVTSSAGAGDAGKIIATDGAGKISSTFLPAGLGASSQDYVTSENLSAGDFVNLYDNAGTPTARKANATDATKPAMGFVLESSTSGDTTTVYFDGQNTEIAIGSFTAADVGKALFLATTGGGVTKTPPSTTGNLVQLLGYIGAVGSTVTIDFIPGPEYVA